MNALTRSVAVAVLHTAMVLSIGGKLMIDRARLPRVWMRALPYDPELPLRGRYVRLRLVPPAGLREFPEPVAFFIPEHVPDPSRRAADEELWVEVTVPRKGPPRPIRLGLMKNGRLAPLALD